MAQHGRGRCDQQRTVYGFINVLEIAWSLGIYRESGDERGAKALEYATTRPNRFRRSLRPPAFAGKLW
jgi:hypothetical protein